MDSATTVTREKLAAGLRMLFANFGAEATPDMLRCYVLGLADLDEAGFDTAVMRSIRELKFLPKVAEIRELAGNKNNPESRAIAAWNDVEPAVRRIGRYRHVSFQDRLCNAVIRNLGGWPTFIDKVNESEKWARIEFIRTYKAFASSGVSGEICLPLPGASQMESVGGVLREPVPRLIECDPDRVELPCRLLPNKQTGGAIGCFKFAPGIELIPQAEATL